MDSSQTGRMELIGLWETPVGETFSHAGAHCPVTDSPALPKPIRSPRPPIIIGGHGAKRTSRPAATHADEFNLPFAPMADFTTQKERVYLQVLDLADLDHIALLGQELIGRV